MSSLTPEEFWDLYEETLDEKLDHPHIEISIAGNAEIADELLALYLSGKKSAGSGLVKDYELAGDPLPEVDNFWIILDSKNNPRCIVKTIAVEINKFSDISKKIAEAEGEGDLSVEHWKKAHRDFFTPYLNDWGIVDLDDEDVVTEFYEVVFQK
ncbi:ASCH domain-containing protein [Halobacteriovorax sp. DPLXC-1]|uniref:ASCH domain-containing protein n=1 Tax=unclassified Halobacteriovorax TaxID=2639665 RepID=UPI002FF0209F